MKTWIVSLICIPVLAILACEGVATNLVVDDDDINQKALRHFAPEIQPYLASIPIRYGHVRTAEAITINEIRAGAEHILVSYDWHQPIFSEKFKVNLITHEYLHHAEVRGGIDLEAFNEDVKAWYDDPEWGESTPGGNYMKYILYWHLYGGNGQEDESHKPPGRGEFAYIGEKIANGPQQRLTEIPQAIVTYYKGILR